MKKIFLIASAMFAAAFLSSCTDDTLTDLTITEVEGMSTGNWKVIFQSDNGNDDSHDLLGYALEFLADGTLTASKGAESFTGTWIVKSSDDDPDYDKEFDFLISGNKAMDELDGSWLIGTLTDNRMELLDDSPSEQIHLERE